MGCHSRGVSYPGYPGSLKGRPSWVEAPTNQVGWVASGFVVQLAMCLFMDTKNQKLLGLIRSCLFIFVFIFITIRGGSSKMLLWFMPESVLPTFSSKSFIVSSLMFNPL